MCKPAGDTKRDGSMGQTLVASESRCTRTVLAVHIRQCCSISREHTVWAWVQADPGSGVCHVSLIDGCPKEVQPARAKCVVAKWRVEADVFCSLLRRLGPGQVAPKDVGNRQYRTRPHIVTRTAAQRHCSSPAPARNGQVSANLHEHNTTRNARPNEKTNKQNMQQSSVHWGAIYN